MSKPPFHSMVNIQKGVRNFSSAPGRVHQAVHERVPDVACIAVFVSFGNEEAQPSTQVSLLLRCLDNGKFGILRGPVFKRFQIEHVKNRFASTLHALVEPAPGLIAKKIGFHHAQEYLVRKQFLAELIFWDQLIEVLRDPNHDIQANLVSEAEGGRIGSTDQRAGDGVNLFDAIPIIECIIHGLHAAVASDPVSNEIGRVFRNHHTLAQPALSKSAHVFHYLGIGIRGRDDLKELEIARRVKKVGSQEMAFESLRTSFDDLRDRNP